MANGSIALGFTLPDVHMTIYNALDESDLEFDQPGPNYRRYPVA